MRISDWSSDVCSSDLQTYDSVEHIVVDGKSQDGTAQKVEERRDLIDVYLSEPDRGIYDAMNKAIGLANGKFMLFMNSGDVFFDRSSLSKLIERAEATNSSAVFGGWVRQSPGGSTEFRKPTLRSEIGRGSCRDRGFQFG